MKFRLLLSVVFVTFLLWVLTTAVLAQEELPPPYAGLKNPFPWNDAAVQEAGKGLYQQSCLGCHGANGGKIDETTGKLQGGLILFSEKRIHEWLEPLFYQVLHC